MLTSALYADQSPPSRSFRLGMRLRRINGIRSAVDVSSPWLGAHHFPFPVWTHHYWPHLMHHISQICRLIEWYRISISEVVGTLGRIIRSDHSTFGGGTGDYEWGFCIGLTGRRNFCHFHNQSFFQECDHAPKILWVFLLVFFEALSSEWNGIPSFS